jgi:L-threonylcarbamoyladenylate synthase
VPEAVDRLMAAFWPGDLTLIMPAGEGMSWDLGNSLGTVQLRLPDDEFLKRLIGTVGPLACTSANRLEQPRPVTAEGAKQQLGVLVGAYLDGGELDGSVSTIVDCTGQSATVVREGSIPAHHIELVAAGELPWGERPEAPPEAADGDGAGGDAAEGADEGTATDDEAVEAADGGSPTDGDAPEGDDEGTDARGGRLTDGAEPATAPIAEPAPAPAADLAADDQSVEPSGDDELPTAPA